MPDAAAATFLRVVAVRARGRGLPPSDEICFAHDGDDGAVAALCMASGERERERRKAKREELALFFSKGVVNGVEEGKK